VSNRRRNSPSWLTVNRYLPSWDSWLERHRFEHILQLPKHGSNRGPLRATAAGGASSQYFVRGQARQTESGPALRCGSEHARLRRLWLICGEVVRPVADEPASEYSSSLNPAECPQVGAAFSHQLSSRPPSDPDDEPETS